MLGWVPCGLPLDWPHTFSGGPLRTVGLPASLTSRLGLDYHKRWLDPTSRDVAHLDDKLFIRLLLMLCGHILPCGSLFKGIQSFILFLGWQYQQDFWRTAVYILCITTHSNIWLTHLSDGQFGNWEQWYTMHVVSHKVSMWLCGLSSYENSWINSADKLEQCICWHYITVSLVLS